MSKSTLSADCAELCRHIDSIKSHQSAIVKQGPDLIARLAHNQHQLAQRLDALESASAAKKR